MTISSKLLSNTHDFCWATGIEDTFIPQTRPGMRALEEYTLTQHYEQWEQDLERAASLGVRAIRWGIPWYRVQPEPGRFDWSWTDQVLDAMVNRFHLVPILDLMHYGTPTWLENSFINASYPQRVAEYAAAAARRYRGLVEVFTPLNEPMVNVDFCGRRAEWPPYLQGEDGAVKLLLAIARGIVMTVEALHAEQPECTLVQVEALWHFHTPSEEHRAAVAFEQASQYLSFDVCTGRMIEGHPILDHLLRHGVQPADLEWFSRHKATFDIFGANFYPWSYGELIPDRMGILRRVKTPTPGSAIGYVLQEAYDRYHLPLMITETSANEPVEGRARWLNETISTVQSLRSQNVPVVGYTWFPMMTMIDWAYRKGRRPVDQYLINLGLYDSRFNEEGVLERKPTALVDQYRQLTRKIID